MPHYREILICITTLVSIGTAQSRNDPLNAYSIPGAVCRITINGVREETACFPRNLLSCVDVDIGVEETRVGISYLALCIPHSCEEGGQRTCDTPEYNSICSEARQEDEVYENDKQRLCPNIRSGPPDGGDDEYYDEYDEEYDEEYDYDGYDDPYQPFQPNNPDRFPTRRPPTTTTTRRPPGGNPRYPSTSRRPPPRVNPTYTPRPPTRVTRDPALPNNPVTPTTFRPTLDRLVMPNQYGRKCSLPPEVQLSMQACLIQSDSQFIERRCPPRSNGERQDCSRTPACRVTINAERVTLYMCSESYINENDRNDEPNYYPTAIPTPPPSNPRDDDNDRNRRNRTNGRDRFPSGTASPWTPWNPDSDRRDRDRTPGPANPPNFPPWFRPRGRNGRPRGGPPNRRGSFQPFFPGGNNERFPSMSDVDPFRQGQDQDQGEDQGQSQEQTRGQGRNNRQSNNRQRNNRGNRRPKRK